MNKEKDKDLQLSSYIFDLPHELIATRPIPGRHFSRLMVYDQSTDTVTHTVFNRLHDFLPRDSLIVANQSKVFPARVLGVKESGGECEFLFLSSVSQKLGDLKGFEEVDTYSVMIRARGRKKVGDKFYLSSLKVQSTILQVESDGTFLVKIEHDNVLSFLDVNGQMPIPPYIRKGQSDLQDSKDYQTVFAKNIGSVAAPTAGLHFTDEVFKNLEEKNIEKAFVTLHVGAGTFAPVKTEDILSHKMHSENYFVDEENLTKIKNATNNLFAVGTTTLRVLESSLNVYNQFDIIPDKDYSTNIFFHPSKKVRSIKGLITNFHLPESTLIMLVSSLIGREKTLELYDIAIKDKYRFFSYGDAMLILRS